ncbi:valyl-tRNA ligase [Halogeometricum pallidum JCM 14848]|uniref:Valine--tRNA ligase n=1 Tax=Halogeometricum pallidum JCM 14848 TaxID=1227487 RepID=M0D6F9_HALPD|nr:valine--tRNA ligase [Halogeometricum pallidum]ELZ31071.1 valyl-tRNA ligase [Halogeometricum pallidum JCM 14848]
MPSGEYDPVTVEAKWQDRWVDEDTYAYAEDADAVDPDTAFSIDSPPPTVSGSLHWGHAYGFTLQDFVARFERMRGENVFFPFGFDDNGIASERLTEDELDVRHQDYDRREFQRMCREVCEGYEAEFTEKMQGLGISIDWEQTYQTISPAVQRTSQLSFIELYDEGREYRQRAPAIWCPECETAISQVETEDDEQDSHFHDIEFDVVNSEESFVISTTRPELLPACVAVFVHPDDDENEHLVGEEARIPIFGQEVPVIEDDRVDLETGSGIVMCCTFGDQTDIEWYQAHDLDLRIAIDESGTLTDVAGEYAGMSSEEAREAIVADLDEAGALLDRRAITHTVNVHERCGTSVEFLVKDQWYIELLDKTDEYLEAGRQMDWYPEKMFTRYKNWIEGLQWDWSISRQRSSGIPFPVWYCEECEHVVVAERESLPVDPLADDPPVDACPECGHDEFVPEDDVFDTWATSSLTPLINAGWDWDAENGETTLDREELYQFDLRPQGHDIISFWLFHTVVKCYEHTGEVPFDSVMINGMVLDENREKMSKSKGNVVSPDEVVSKYPVDAARYWAAGSAVGDDLPYSEKGLRAGEKLIRKLWNASKLVESLTHEAPAEFDHDELHALDRWLLAELDREIDRVTEKLENREFSKARDGLRSFFWSTFCDDYLEIAKQRVREDDDDSAKYTLRTAHRRFVKLFAPVLAHATEELWRDMYGEEAASVHRAAWPEPLGVDADVAAGETAMAVVGALRKYKSDNQLSMNASVDHVLVYGDVRGFEEDISGVMHVEELETSSEGPPIESVVTGVDLDYSLVGPEFGAQVPDIESAIEAEEYEVVDGELRAGDAELDSEMFTIEEERKYTGEGEMLEAGDAVVIVRHGD